MSPTTSTDPVRGPRVPAATELVSTVLRHAETRPTAPALWWHGDEVPYRELRERAAHQRDRVRELGFPPGVPVGLRVGKDPDSVALVLGAQEAGHPFLLLAAGAPRQVQAALLARAGCRATLSPDRVERGPAAPGSPLPAEVSFVLTTSGSTGIPKIVPLPAAGVDAFVAWAGERFAIAPGARVLSYAPLSFDLSLLDVWTTLAHGATCVLADPRDALRDRHMAGVVDRGGVSVLQAVPMLFALLAGTGQTFGSVAHAVLTGDVTPPERVAELAAAFPRARLYNLYGATETNDSLLAEIDPARDPAVPLPLGAPLPGVAVSLVGADGRERAGAGEGELWVRTPFQSPGYHGPAPADRFVPHPADPAGPTWFRTGDLVRRDPGGRLTLVGRTDSRVKVRGVGVDLAAVEHALGSHPDIAEVAAALAPAPPAGDALVAVVRRSPGRAVTSLALRGHCAALLPPQAVPGELRIVDDALPRNAHGKVDRSAAVRLHRSPDPAQGD